MEDDSEKPQTYQNKFGIPLQNCPKCLSMIGAFPGGRDAVCLNCGYKDPCCE